MTAWDALDANFPKYAKKRRAALKRLLASIGDKALDQGSQLDVERFKRERLACTSGKGPSPRRRAPPRATTPSSSA